MFNVLEPKTKMHVILNTHFFYSNFYSNDNYTTATLIMVTEHMNWWHPKLKEEISTKLPVSRSGAALLSSRSLCCCCRCCCAAQQPCCSLRGEMWLWRVASTHQDLADEIASPATWALLHLCCRFHLLNTRGQKRHLLIGIGFWSVCKAIGSHSNWYFSAFDMIR